MQPSRNDFSLEKLHPLTRILLEKRGVVGEQEVYDFLFPSYEKHVGDPFGIYGMRKAVERIVEAIKNEEKIAIYSDYDCDGVPGGVLLRSFFDDIGYPVRIYIPHRHNEGYGVHTHAIDKLKAQGVSLIMTDHHLPVTKEVKDVKTKKLSSMQVVPDAIAVLNSKQDTCTYDDDMLCGCAVAWKLACALLSVLRTESKAHASFLVASSKKQETGGKNTKGTHMYNAVLERVAGLPEGFEKWYLDLVGISTVADMVPLQKENRALAYYGLKVLRKTKRPGLLHVFNEQRVKKEFLAEEDIAFTIAPRINAASRMGDPIQAHLMLYEKDRESAEGYAFDLEELNTQRKGEVKDVVEGISFDHAAYSNDVVVVGDPSWGPGILGLIAQKIIDETGKPTFVWGCGDSQSVTTGIDSELETADNTIVLKGSCRSRGDVSVVDLMAHIGKVDVGGVFEGYGGHEQAGGFSLLALNIDKLSSSLNESYKHVEKKEVGGEEVVIDAELSVDDIHDVTYDAIAALAPFGEGNRKPVFAIKNPQVLAIKWFGKKGEHFEVVYATSKGGKIKAIQFFASKDIEEKVASSHTALVHIERSYFGGRVELRMRLVEAR